MGLLCPLCSSRQADVLRRGYPFGFTTSWAVHHVEHTLQGLPPELQRTLFILWFGVSDMAVVPGASESSVRGLFKLILNLI